MCCSPWLGDCAGPYWFSNWQVQSLWPARSSFPSSQHSRAILAIGVVPLIAYQYWRDVRMLHMPTLAGICRPKWSGIRLKTATMSSLAPTTVDPVHGSSGEDGLDPQTSFRNG